MNKKVLRVKSETETGLNKTFINQSTGATITLEQAITQINKGNPTYEGYHVVNRQGVDYIRSNPDNSQTNNIE